ncbi:hypothetical protein Hanom_Chr06g00532641 [Helianthus anomalus]
MIELVLSKGFGRRDWKKQTLFYYTPQTFGPPLLVQTFADVVRRLQTFYI